MNTRWVKLAAVLFVIGILFTCLFYLFGHQGKGWLGIINSAFLVSLAYFVIGGFMFVYYGGFFRGIAFSFRNFFRSKGDIYAQELSKSQDEILNIQKREDPEIPARHENKQPPRTWAFLINAAIYFIFSMTLAYVLYY